MAPLPKRRHSTQRKGKRLKSRTMVLPKLVSCKQCGKSKLSHKICRYCNK